MSARLHPILLRILAREGATDDRRIPGTLSPRALFPEPALYLASVRAASRPTLGAAALWNCWFSQREWPLAIQPPGAAHTPLPAPDPEAARALFLKAKHSEAVGYLGRELASCGFNPRWAENAAGALKIACRQITLRQVFSVVDQAIFQMSVAYLKGRGLFELQESMRAHLVRPPALAQVQLRPSNCLLTDWMCESLQQDGVSFWDFVPVGVKRGRRDQDDAHVAPTPASVSQQPPLGGAARAELR